MQEGAGREKREWEEKKEGGAPLIRDAKKMPEEKQGLE